MILDMDTETFNDVFSSMADFLKSEITLIKQHNEEMQILFPSLKALDKTPPNTL